MIKRTLLGATAVAATLVLAACGSSDNTASDNGGATAGASGAAGANLSLVKDGSLTVCSDAPYKPFDVIDGDTFGGFDGDVITAVAGKLGLKVVPIDTGFDAISSGLAVKSHQCDMSASAMTITDERKANITFSEPYYDSKQSLLVPAGSDIATLADTDGKKIGVQKDTTGESYAKEHASGAKIYSFPDDAAEFAALQGGTVDALLQDLPVNLEHTTDDKYKIAEQYDTGEQYGFGFNKTGSEDLVKAFDDALASMKSDGSYDAIYNKYFATN